jgi:hypothetical protein
MSAGRDVAREVHARAIKDGKTLRISVRNFIERETGEIADDLQATPYIICLVFAGRRTAPAGAIAVRCNDMGKNRKGNTWWRGGRKA